MITMKFLQGTLFFHCDDQHDEAVCSLLRHDICLCPVDYDTRIERYLEKLISGEPDERESLINHQPVGRVAQEISAP